MRKSLALFSAAVMVATSAAAAERSGFYVGGDVGQSNWGVTQSDANALAAGLGEALADNGAWSAITFAKGKANDTDFTYSLFVGYQFVPWLAVEGTYMDLGQEDVKVSGTYTYVAPPCNPTVDLNCPTGGSFGSKVRFDSAGWALSALPMLPLGDSWNLYGRLGYYWGDNKASASVSTQDVNRLGDPLVGITRKYHDTDTSGVFLWGAGISYTWDQRVSMRFEYDNLSKVAHSVDETDVERFTLGLVYRFGHKEEAAPVVAAAPVAAAPVAAKCADSDNDGVCDTADKCPNTPAGERVGPYGCSCDIVIRTHFAFDSAELTAEDKATLDTVAQRLKDLQFVEGTATGHTDSTGEEAYNQKLSERRAQAVVDYLAAQGVAPGRIKAIGMGESKPLADNATEEGRAQNRRVTIRRTDCGPAD